MAFLKRLVHGAERPVFLILGSHSIHRAALVKEFVRSRLGMLRLFYRPPYSPELNPDELVQDDAKSNGASRRSLRQRGDLKRAVVRHLRRLRRSRHRLRDFFREKNVSCAA